MTGLPQCNAKTLFGRPASAVCDGTAIRVTNAHVSVQVDRQTKVWCANTLHVLQRVEVAMDWHYSKSLIVDKKRRFE